MPPMPPQTQPQQNLAPLTNQPARAPGATNVFRVGFPPEARTRVVLTSSIGSATSTAPVALTGVAAAAATRAARVVPMVTVAEEQVAAAVIAAPQMAIQTPTVASSAASHHPANGPAAAAPGTSFATTAPTSTPNRASFRSLSVAITLYRWSVHCASIHQVIAPFVSATDVVSFVSQRQRCLLLGPWQTLQRATRRQKQRWQLTLHKCMVSPAPSWVCRVRRLEMLGCRPPFWLPSSRRWVEV